jgi:hypothetical protein
VPCFPTHYPHITIATDVFADGKPIARFGDMMLGQITFPDSPDAIIHDLD